MKLLQLLMTNEGMGTHVSHLPLYQAFATHNAPGPGLFEPDANDANHNEC